MFMKKYGTGHIICNDCNFRTTPCGISVTPLIFNNKFIFYTNTVFIFNEESFE